MPHVVTERCVDCRYTDCCAVCPVECFYEIKDPAMLVIDPDTCIDCGLCIPECPIYAIYPQNEVPEYYQDWIQKNAELFKDGTQVSTKVDALPSAIPLEKIHEREKSRGWSAKDPSAVSDEGGGAEAPAADAAPAETPAATPAPAPEPEKPATPAAAAAPKEAVRVPKTPPRPPLEFGVGARIRIHHRVGTVREMRQGGTGYYDVLVHLDGDTRPVWYLYSALQTFRDEDKLAILDPGRRPGLLARLFSS